MSEVTQDELLKAALLALQICADNEGTIFQNQWQGYGMKPEHEEALDRALRELEMPEVPA